MPDQPSPITLRTYRLTVDHAMEIIGRVSAVCVGRQARIVSLRYSAPPPGGRLAALDLVVEVDERHGRTLARRFETLIQVRSVSEQSGVAGGREQMMSAPPTEAAGDPTTLSRPGRRSPGPARAQAR